MLAAVVSEFGATEVLVTSEVADLVAVAAATGSLLWALSYARQGYEPRQPIPFRHSRMAGPPVWETNAAFARPVSLFGAQANPKRSGPDLVEAKLRSA